MKKYDKEQIIKEIKKNVDFEKLKQKYGISESTYRRYKKELEIKTQNSNNNKKEIVKKTMNIFIVVLIPVIIPILYNIYQDKYSTDFEVYYYYINLYDYKTLVNEYSENDTLNLHTKRMLYPSLETEVKKLIKENSSQLYFNSTYIKFLVIEQTGSTPAKDIKIELNKKVSKQPIENEITNIKLTDYEMYEETVNIDTIPISEEMGIKIPLAICNVNFEEDKEEVFYMEYEPIKIQYNNKYTLRQMSYTIRKKKKMVQLENNWGIGGEDFLVEYN